MSLIWDTQTDERRQRLENSQEIVWNWTTIRWLLIALAFSLGIWYGVAEGSTALYKWWIR